MWRKEYLLYKQQWLSITKVQESKFRKFRQRKFLIGNNEFVFFRMKIFWQESIRSPCLIFLQKTIQSVQIENILLSVTIKVPLSKNFTIFFSPTASTISILVWTISLTFHWNLFSLDSDDCQIDTWEGYVQGMSDLLAPLLLVIEDEADTFWCFKGYMDLVVWSLHFELIEIL
jgi:hypothetical protein